VRQLRAAQHVVAVEPPNQRPEQPTQSSNVIAAYPLARGLNALLLLILPRLVQVRQIDGAPAAAQLRTEKRNSAITRTRDRSARRPVEAVCTGR
jgi:hypothetical protein